MGFTVAFYTTELTKYISEFIFVIRTFDNYLKNLDNNDFYLVPYGCLINLKLLIYFSGLFKLSDLDLLKPD